MSGVTQLQRDRDLILIAMKKKIRHSSRTGILIGSPDEQLIESPFALSDNTANPLKGNKTYTTRSLQSRYEDASPPVIVTDYQWEPECTIMEGMSLINTTPLGGQNTLADYARFLMHRFITPRFTKRSKEVHIVFDNPLTPKYFEHKYRDRVAKITEDHCCREMLPFTGIPKNWREGLLNCRQCKCTPVVIPSTYLLRNINNYLQQNQSLYVAGDFDDPNPRCCLECTRKWTT